MRWSPASPIPAAPRTYGDTLGLLDEARGVIADVFGRTGFMGYVHPEADGRAAGHAAAQRLESWLVDLPFDPAVAAAVTEFAATPEAAALTGERRPAAGVHPAATSAGPATS